MKDDNKTKKQLVHELSELRSQNAKLKKSITRSMSAELAVEEARRYAENIVETVREPLLILDAELKIISANRNFFRTFKVTPGETIGSFIYDLGNKQWDIPELQKLLEEVLPEKQAFDDFEVVHNFQDIGQKIMLLNARKIYQKDIGVNMILLAIEDITERMEIEKGLEKTRKELETAKISEDAAREYAESIINTIREPLIALDQDLRVVTANRSFYNVFKVKIEETIGQLIYDLGNKQWDIPKLRELLETILPQKTTFDNYEVEHDFTTIGKRIMLLNARQIQRVLGKERIILMAIEDITERKKTEETLKERAQQLKDANEELESFSYSVSHDLKAPLRSVDGYSGMLIKKYGSTLDVDAARMINVISSKTKMMGVLIDDLLSFSKVLKSSMTMSEIDMDKLTKEVWNNIRMTNSERELEVKITKLLPGFGDRALIRQVLFNLISNAVKFTKNRKPGIIEMSSYIESDKIVYCLKDNGAGFDMAYYDKLFGVFQRLHSHEEYEGTGVGLSIVQRIVKRHGGRVWAEGEVDKGATFYFSLPHEKR